MQVNISNKSSGMDPRVDSLIEDQSTTIGEITVTQEWVSEINRGLDRALDEIFHVERRIVEDLTISSVNSNSAFYDLNARLSALENLAPVRQLPARYDDTKIFDHLSSLENLALETVAELEVLGKKNEADVRQLRIDLMRVAGRLQQLELQTKSTPWYQRLAFWKRK